MFRLVWCTVHYDINKGYEENIFKKERFPLNKYFYFIFKNKAYPTSDFAQVKCEKTNKQTNKQTKTFILYQLYYVQNEKGREELPMNQSKALICTMQKHFFLPKLDGWM